MADSSLKRPTEWQKMGMDDLECLNTYSRCKIDAKGPNLPFYALNRHWAEPISPGIPDGRYVIKTPNPFEILNLHFSHQILGAWDGHSHSSSGTIGGCSAIGVDSEGRFGLVHKANQNHGGIFRTISNHQDSQHRLIQPIQIRFIPEMRKCKTSYLKRLG